MNTVIDLSRGIPWTIFLSGIIFATFAASGLFFVKFWKKTKEPFFSVFAFALWILALERIPLLTLGPDSEAYWIYLFRLSAFVLIILAVQRANRSS